MLEEYKLKKAYIGEYIRPREPSWVLSDAAWDSNYFDYGGTGVMAPFVTNDGLYMYIPNESSNTIRQYSLGTAFDLGSVTQLTQVNCSSIPHQVYVSDDGSKLFCGCWTSQAIDIFEMSTPFDLSTATKTTINYGENINALTFANNGNYLYVGTDNYITVYTLSTPWDVTTRILLQSVYVNYTHRGYAMDESGKYSFNNDQNLSYQYQRNTSTDYIPVGSSYDYRLSLPFSSSRISLTGNLTKNNKYLYTTIAYRYIYRINMPQL